MYMSTVDRYMWWTHSSFSDHPNPRTIRSSCVGFSWNDAIKPGWPDLAPANTKWSPMSVLPDPDGPATSVEAPGQRPDPKASSKSETPEEIRSTSWSYPASSAGSASLGKTSSPREESR